MYARVVRFTDVDPERITASKARIEESEGPPEGSRMKGVSVYHDEEQRTAVVIQLYETAEDMAAGDEVMSAMDPADTPGTRASVDRGELKVERGLS